MKVIPVLMAGGAGTRLWPLSTDKMPKPYIQLEQLHDRSMLQETAQRTTGIFPGNMGGPQVVACREKDRDYVVEQMLDSGIEEFRLLLEPHVRNTAATVGAAAWLAFEWDEDPVLVVFPTDHWIYGEEYFALTIRTAVQTMEKGDCMVLIGTPAKSPSTEYGYISATVDPTSPHVEEALKITGFMEKPNRELASEFVAQGLYWNTGIYVVRARVYLQLLERHSPETHRSIVKGMDLGQYPDFNTTLLSERVWEGIAGMSLDYAVTQRAALDSMADYPLQMVPLDERCTWKDIGTWQTLLELGSVDAAGNILAEGNAEFPGSSNCRVFTDNERSIVLQGMDDISVIQIGEQTFIVPNGEVDRLYQG